MLAMKRPSLEELHVVPNEPSVVTAIRGIRHIDHVTYAGAAKNERSFLRSWRMLGFRELVRLRTVVYPATHIALVSGVSAGHPWGTMTGLSVSEDPASPVNEYVRRYGEGLQHVAYNVDPDVEIEELFEEMQDIGWVFMTPVLTYQDGAGARLKQMFSAPETPYGPFVEFVQRFDGPNGAAFDGFDVRNIDDLYEEYAKYSRWLDGRGQRAMPIAQPME
jgi:4-hydroxyphenylpyruvate dioxygenase-like putative hemolysin